MTLPPRLQWPLRSNLGRRLFIACAGLIVLVLLTGLLGIATTTTVSRQMQALIEHSVPAINGNQQLVQGSTQMQRLAQSLVDASHLADIAQRQQRIEQSLHHMLSGAQSLHLTNPAQATLLIRQIKASGLAAEQLAQAVQQRQANRNALRMLLMRLDWLHDDLASEFAVLIDEQLLTLNNALRSGQRGENVQWLARDVAQLTRMAQQEKHIADALRTLASLSRPDDNHTVMLAALHQQLTPLTQQTTQLHTTENGGLHHLLAQLQQFTIPDGELAQALARYQQSQQYTRQQQQQLDRALSQQNRLASLLGQQAQNNARLQLRTAASTSEYSRWLVIGATLIAILLTLWIMFGLIGHRVIARLALLGKNIDAIIHGHYPLPHHIRGRDDIARLGERIQTLASQMAELERTKALALLEHTDAALLICRQDGEVTSINRAARAFFPALEVGRKLDTLLPANICQTMQALAEGDTLDISLPFGLQEDEQALRFIVRSFLQAGEIWQVVTLLDISAQTRSARWLARMVSEKTAALDEANAVLRQEILARKRTQDSLLQATKLAVLGQTTTSLAHELNQPLSALTNYLYTAGLQLNPGSDDALRHTLQQGSKVVERMSRLVRSYRTLAREAPALPALNTVDAAQVVRDVLELLQGRIRKQRIRLILAMPDKLTVLGEIVRLEQITLNLLSNALDALQEQDEATLSLSLQQTATQVELWIGDNGPGLRHDTCEQIFQPFYTTKTDGLGLGLSICQTLAGECGADILAANLLPRGALFILVMKAADVD